MSINQEGAVERTGSDGFGQRADRVIERVAQAQGVLRGRPAGKPVESWMNAWSFVQPDVQTPRGPNAMFRLATHFVLDHSHFLNMRLGRQYVWKGDVRRIRAFAILVAIVAMTTTQSANASSWKKDVTNKVAEVYKPSHISLWDGALKEGYDTLVVTQPGIFAWPARDSGYPNTRVTNGKAATGRGVDVHSGAREFRKGERVLIFDMDADSDDDHDYLCLDLLSKEATDRQEQGTTVGTRYKGGACFIFPYKTLASTDFAEIKKAINAVLVSEAEFKANDSPPTVRFGMGVQEVEQSLGKPQKVVDLGGKKVYVYSDLKITFIDGKVADVQ